MIYESLVPLTTEQLRITCMSPPETDYPPLVNERGESNRLYIPHTVMSKMMQDEEIIIPEGPWSLRDHPNRQKAGARGEAHLLDEVATPDNPIPMDRVAEWQSRGLAVTADTRVPINPRAFHPDVPQVLTTPGFGMFTEFGFHYHYGPAEISNFVLRREWNDQVWYLMTGVLRSNPPTVRIGVPGGYVLRDPKTHKITESLVDGGLRESAEEGGFTEKVRERIGPLIISEPTYSPPDGKGRDTLFAWGEEWFVGARSEENPALEGYAPEILDNDEKIVFASWIKYAMTQHPNVPVMGPHRRAIRAYEKSVRRARYHRRAA